MIDGILTEMYKNLLESLSWNQLDDRRAVRKLLFAERIRKYLPTITHFGYDLLIIKKEKIVRKNQMDASAADRQFIVRVNNDYEICIFTCSYYNITSTYLHCCKKKKK